MANGSVAPRRVVTWCALLGAVTGCNGAASSPAPAPKASTVSAPTNQDPGFVVTDGAAPFVVDGDRLVELRDGVVLVRDAKLVEIDRLGTGVKSFAVLPGHGIAMRSGLTLQIAAGGTSTTYTNALNDVVATDQPDEIWQVGATVATRSALVKGADANRLRATKASKLPEGVRPAHATLSDGSLAIAGQSAILVVSDAGLTPYAWSGAARHLGPGPDASSVWVSTDLHHVTLLKLAEGKAVPTAVHAAKADETIVHMAAAGAHAAAVVAQGTGTQVTYSLVVFTAKGEAWRASLGAAPSSYLVALDARRVVVREDPSHRFRVFDVATGKAL